MTKRIDPLAIASAAVVARIEAARALHRAAVIERNAEAQAAQREILHALIDEQLDIEGGMLTKIMRGEQ